MAGTNPVGTFGVTNVTSQTPQEWFVQSDGNSAVVERPADAFAPHPAASANMTVVLDAGFIDSVSPAGQETITEVASQTVTIAAAPISPNNRIDLISIDAGTGVYTYTQGTAAGSPSAPALPVGQRQICQVSVPNGTAVIGSGNITDLRSVWGPFGRGIPFAIAGGSSDALAGTFTPATPTLGNAFNGYIWRVRAIAANTITTPTFAPDGQGPWVIKKNGTLALAPNDIAGINQDILLSYNYNSGAPFIELLNPAGNPGVVGGQCRLVLSGSNLVLSPYNGNNIIINGAQYQIPSVGVSLPPTGLSIGTFYYIYAYVSGSTIALIASTTTHATDAATGIEIMSGNAAYSLVGAAYVVSGPAFVDTNAERYVLSWFNRKPKVSTTSFSTNRSTTSTSFVEINSEIRSNFITWADEIVLSAITGELSSNVAGGQINSALAFDGTTPSGFLTFVQVPLANSGGNGALSAAAFFSEATLHFQTIVGAVSNGTGTWNATSVPTPGSANNVLTVTIQG